MGGIVKGIGKAFKGLLGGILGAKQEIPEPPPAPVVTPPTPVPLLDDEAVAAAKRRSIAKQMQRSGRASTMLTKDPVTGDTLG